MPDLARFEIVDECWIWTGNIAPHGYGRLSIRWPSDGKKHTVYAHRAVYEEYVQPVPDGLVIDHLCRNRACVNPDHLEPVTRGENVMRGETIPAANAAKTHCKWDHEFTPANTARTRKGARECIACRRAST